MSSSIPSEAVELAREMRLRMGTRANGQTLPPSWETVAAELARLGHGRLMPFDAEKLAAACAEAPLETHPLAPPDPERQRELERTWREGWAEEFPGEPWPGFDEARIRLRARFTALPQQRRTR
ncbi:MAG TPA: hypothetical protein VN646_16925 [Candidatus Acidoferrum sp.]|nr:hypothetical protein [Candidatus Acidoferrum sp.]